MFLKNGTMRSALPGRSVAKPLVTHCTNRFQAWVALAVGTTNARYTAATRPITDCQKYFSRADSPFGLRGPTLHYSSAEPIAPKPSVTASTIHTKRLDQSAQRTVVTAIETRMRAPPIVGVPAFARCV